MLFSIKIYDKYVDKSANTTRKDLLQVGNTISSIEPSTVRTAESALVGRQSIYDKDLNVYAYELLYRSSESTSLAPHKFDGNVATTQVMLNTFLELGLDNIVGDKPAFINLTEDFIVGTFRIPKFDHDVILEILEDVKPTEQVIKGISDLKNKGFVIALDDFSFAAELLPLVRLADFIKVDITLLGKTELASYIKTLKKTFKGKLLAEKIETQEEYEYCRELGFEYFQGYFLEKPKIVKGQKLPSNKLAILQLLAKLQDPDVKIEDLEKLVANDASLSFKLIRYVNSPVYNTGQNITSIKQVLLLLGLENLKQWVTLIVISGIDDKPSDLIRISLIRAKMCVDLAERAKQENPHEFLFIGLFSILNAMLDQELDVILKSIPIKRSVKEALLEHKGVGGRILKSVIAYEHGDLAALKKTKIKASLLRKSYLSSIKWADDVLSGIAV